MNTQQSLTIGSRRVEREHTPAYARAMQWVLCMHAIHDPHLHDDGDDDGDGDDNDGNNDDDDVPTSTHTCVRDTYIKYAIIMNECIAVVVVVEAVGGAWLT